MKYKLARVLTKLRKDANLKQVYVAAYLYKCRTAYQHYEKGRRVPDIFTLHRLSGLYGISLDEIMKML